MFPSCCVCLSPLCVLAPMGGDPRFRTSRRDPIGSCVCVCVCLCVHVGKYKEIARARCKRGCAGVMSFFICLVCQSVCVCVCVCVCAGKNASHFDTMKQIKNENKISMRTGNDVLHLDIMKQQKMKTTFFIPYRKYLHPCFCE